MFGFLKRKNNEVEDFENDDDSLKAYIPRSERESAYKEASITFPTGYKVRGIVMDHSDGGVRIRFMNVEHLPDFVQLDVPALKIHTQARVAWHDSIDYGLEFLSTDLK